MEIRKGGLYWGKPTEQAITALSSWDLVILNEANTFSMIEQPSANLFVSRLKRANPNIKIGISFNAYSVFVDSKGEPSVYFPIQQDIHEAATKYNAWLLVNGKFVETKAPNGSTSRLFDIRIKGFRDELITIINSYIYLASGVDFIHFDELHSTLGFFPNPTLMPKDEEWTEATYTFLTKIKSPFMGNGTYDVSLHNKGKSRGRFVQNANDQGNYSLKTIQDVAVYLKNDLALPAKQRFIVLNLIDTFDKTAWGKFAYGIDAYVQTYPGGKRENFSDYNIQDISY